MNTYWQRTGRFQKEYNEIMGNPKSVWKSDEIKARDIYYRYYNDGVMLRSAADMRKQDFERWIETQADISIARVYERLHGGDVSMTIKGYAKSPLGVHTMSNFKV